MRTIAVLLDLSRPAPAPQTVAVAVRYGLLVTATADERQAWDGLLTAEERTRALALLSEANRRVIRQATACGGAR